MSTAYDFHLTTDTAGEAADAESEAVSVRLSEMEKDPDAIERAINGVDCDFTDELMALRIKAYMTGAAADRKVLEDRESTLIAAELLKRARRQIADEFGSRRVRTAGSFADMLQRPRAVVSP